MKKSAITPIRLRIILAVLLVLLVGAGVGVFTLGYQQLNKHAAGAQEVAAKAQASQASLQNLITVKKFLSDNEEVVQRADKLVSQSKLYYYQDQMINDINKYATESGIEIQNISFEEIKATPLATTPAAPVAGVTPGAAAPAPANIKSRLGTISIKNPTNYDSMLTFIHRVEQSLFSMQISRVGISKSSEAQSPDQVTSDAFTLEVYVRE